MIRLGYQVGSGEILEIPLAHTFVSGQTQQSGKTTALQAIVERSRRRALAFITKRGEDLAGRRIRPYLPRRFEQPIHWRLVEAMLASALDQKRLQSIERLWLIKAAKGAYSLDDVQTNIRALLAKTKSDRSQDIYTLLDEYLELVLPQMRSLDASETLDLQPGLNVMDLGGLAAQTQGMVIRAALECINHHDTHVLTVLPEAWEFAPRERSAPAKFEAEAMARKGAAPKVENFLLVDSQDIAGVATTVRQACSVWLLGVQRELNELRRALQMMPAGVKRPKADDVATLQLGQFYVCFGTHVIKAYVQPSWMPDDLARKVAKGQIDVSNAASIAGAANVKRAADDTLLRSFDVMRRAKQRAFQEDEVTKEEAARLKDENETLRRAYDRAVAEGNELRRRLEALEKGSHDRPAPDGAATAHPRSAAKNRSAAVRVEPAVPGAGSTTQAGAAAAASSNGVVDEATYQAIKARLMDEAPQLLKVLVDRPELEVAIERQVVTADGTSTKGRVARLIAAEYLAESKRFSEILRELERTGTRVNNKSLSVALQELVVAGFLTKESVDRYKAVADMRVRVVES